MNTGITVRVRAGTEGFYESTGHQSRNLLGIELRLKLLLAIAHRVYGVSEL